MPTEITTGLFGAIAEAMNGEIKRTYEPDPVLDKIAGQIVRAAAVCRANGITISDMTVRTSAKRLDGAIINTPHGPIRIRVKPALFPEPL